MDLVQNSQEYRVPIGFKLWYPYPHPGIFTRVYSYPGYFSMVYRAHRSSWYGYGSQI